MINPAMAAWWWGFVAAATLMAGTVDAQRVPGSDAFAGRPPLPDDAMATGDWRDGSPEPGEPALPGNPRGQTLWWRYVAARPGRVRIEAATNAVVPLVAAYRGTQLETLVPVEDNQSTFSSACHGIESRLRPILDFDVVEGEEYAVVADWNDPTPPGSDSPPPAGGPFEFRLLFVPRPANDDLAGAEPLAGSAVRARATLFAASSEDGEPLHGENPGGRSVWFTWTAPETGQVEITPGQARVFPTPAARPGPLPWADRTELAQSWPLLAENWSLPPGYGSVMTIETGGGGIPDFCAFHEVEPAPPFFPVFGVYEGEGPALRPVAGGTNLSFFVFGNTTLRLAVAGNLGTGEAMDFQLRLTPRPVNLAFEERISLPGSSAEAEGHTVGTGWSAGGTPTPGLSHQPRTWWTWTAPAEGPAWLATVISDREVGFEIQTGATLNELREVAAGSTKVTFYARRGVEYQISTAVAEAPGEFRFSLRHLPARLRSALVTGLPEHRGLLLAESDAPRILVQLADEWRWRDAGFAIPPSGLPADATGYFLPLGALSAGAVAGRARVWLLDFPLPELRLLPLQAQLVRAGTGFVEVAGVPGQRVEFESSTDLHHWRPGQARTLKDFFDYVLEDFPESEGARFYRAREDTLEVRPLRADGP